MFTLCSMYPTIQFSDMVKDWKRMRWYDYGIVDDASKVADEYLFPILYCTSYNAFTHEINWPKSVFCGSPYELEPDNGSQLSGMY